VTSEDSIIDAAKSLVDLAKEFASLQLKHAVFEGDPMLLTVEQLSKMRTKSEILGEVAMLIASPGRAIAGCLRSPQAKIAGCLKAMIDKAA
jgi:ribosomal protein L10